jgi:hypothetical protein
VLAGSIIEAILLDYLIAVRHSNLPEEKLLKWDFGQCIEAGEKEGILTSKTAPMCVVVKGYRNLIHPGRVIRLEEKVDGEGATVALSLVRMVARDIGKKKAEVYGCSAEQLVGKIERDMECTAILPHLLREMKETEKVRLLLEVLPKRVYEWHVQPQDIDDPCASNVSTALAPCFRLVLAQAGLETRRKVVEQYVTVLKEQAAGYRECYEESFFKVSDLEGVATWEEIDLIKKHIFQRLRWGYNTRVLAMAEGIGQHITSEDVKNKSARAIWAPLLSCEDHEEEGFINWFSEEYRRVPHRANLELIEYMQSEVKLLRTTDKTYHAALVQRAIESCPLF